MEDRYRSSAERALNGYSKVWKSWAAGEAPRRKTIGLYGELFALKQQIEAEQTSKPEELVWGVGISTWQLQFEDRQVLFEYPLLTQLVEVSLDEGTMAIEVRPRASNTRVEMDAFITCGIINAIEAEQTVMSDLSQSGEPSLPLILALTRTF